MYVLVGLIIHVNDGGFVHVPVPVLLLLMMICLSLSQRDPVWPGTIVTDQAGASSPVG